MNKHIKRLIEISDYGLVPKTYYEFHLSTEPDLKEGLPFSQQHRNNSSFGERGTMGTEDSNVIYTTNSPENWYDQFKMELVDAPEYIPNNLYIVKVKNPSVGGNLNQAINKPEDTIVIKKIPNIGDEPNFNLGEKYKSQLEQNLLK